MLQTGSINTGLYGNTAYSTFNFNGGTLQCLAPCPGAAFSSSVPITVGTAVSNIVTVDANGQTMGLDYGYTAGGQTLVGPGQLVVIDSAGGGTVVLGGTDFNRNSFGNYYTGGTTVLSGTLQVFDSTSLPSVGVLTVAGPGSIVSSTRAGTLFESNGIGQAVIVESIGGDITSSTPVADASGTTVATLATGLSMIPVGSGPAPVPEPSTLLLLSTALLLSRLGYARRQKAGQEPAVGDCPNFRSTKMGLSL